MRDQRELALQCLEVEDAGGSVIEFLKGLGFISASATWQRLQLNELGRLPSKLRDGKENVNMGKLTLEDKKKAVQIAVDGGNPLEYIRSCGVKNAAEAWGKIKRVVKETDPEAFEKIPKRLPLPKKEKEAILAGAAGGMKSAAEAVRDMKDAAEDFFGKCRDMGLKVGAQEVVAAVMTPEGPKDAGRLVRENRYTVTAVSCPDLGEFYHDRKFNSIDWRTTEGDKVSLSPTGWKILIRDLPEILTMLGVEV